MNSTMYVLVMYISRFGQSYLFLKSAIYCPISYIIKYMSFSMSRALCVLQH